ncbi:MAG: hypothetical protein OXE83_08840 [Gammaproteobacteria bacterium]|nr:hypothetical protein [Gammaproteobacteria bacterium]
MIRQTMRCLVLAAAGLAVAGGAWGQILRQSSSAPVMVALEYFGASAGREIEASGFSPRPYVALTPGDTAVGLGNVAEITFTLTGATFSQTVSPANLDRRTACTAATTEQGLLATVARGGARGDSSVTFRAEISGTGAAALSSSSALCFWVPNVQATLANLSPPGTPPATQVMGVGVTATISQSGAASNPFPSRISGPAAGDVDADMSNDITGAEIGSSPNSAARVFTGARALNTRLLGGGMAQVALTDRTKIASGGLPDPSASNPRTAATGLLVGRLSIAAASNASSIWQLDGGGAVIDGDGDLDGSLGGQITVSVGGPFQEGDKVVFDLPGSTAARSVPASGGMASTSLELDPGVTPIVYVPGGGTLTPSTFVAMAKYAFNSLDNDSALRIAPTSGTITYRGINVEGYAYGVVRGGGVESSIARVTCEAVSGACQVFADCTDQAGESYFGGPVPVPAGATAVWTSDALAGVLEGGWDAGRGRCEIWSTHSLAVQHMVRSGHALINNSTVVGRGLDENADGGIQAVADRICRSVGSGDGEQDGDDDGDGGTFDTDVDTACMPVDTMPPPAT